jgi:hypothetical protein
MVYGSPSTNTGKTAMNQFNEPGADHGIGRRDVLKCMTWAGAAVL